MKKLRTTLFVCLTALAVLTAFGCKQEAAVGDDVKAWKYQDEINEEGTLQIVVDKNGPVKWAVVVDEYNRIVKDASGYVPVNSENIAKAAETVNQTQALQFKGLGAGKYTVYVYQPGVELEANGQKGTAETLKRDLRGTVTIKAKKGVSVKISNYAQHVPSVGIVTMRNNERKGVSGATWPGDYGVRTVKAVREENGKWVEVEGYTVTAESGYVIDQAPSSGSYTEKKMLFPKGDFHIAVNQPDRLNGASEDAIKTHIKNSWTGKQFPGQIKEEEQTSAKNIAAYRDYQNKAFWVKSGTPVKVVAHEDTLVLKTGDNNAYLNPDNIPVEGKYAAPAVYEIVEAPAGER